MSNKLSYDGKGINGPDEFKTRIATFTSSEYAEEYGHLFETAPELLDALENMVKRFYGVTVTESQIKAMEAAIKAVSSAYKF